MYQQGDLCPHCGLIIAMPTDLQAECLGCGEEINQDADYDHYEEEEWRNTAFSDLFNSLVLISIVRI